MQLDYEDGAVRVYKSDWDVRGDAFEQISSKHKMSCRVLPYLDLEGAPQHLV